jgi:ATP synthase protein I
VRAEPVHRGEHYHHHRRRRNRNIRFWTGTKKRLEATLEPARPSLLNPAAMRGFVLFPMSLPQARGFLTRIDPVSMVRAALRRRKCRDLAWTVAGVESMADDARERGDRKQPPLDEAALSARFKRLGERLGHIHPDRPSERSPGQRSTADPSAIARGFRLSTELVAGVLVGAAVGWVIDRWLGISPWGMIVFLLLGFTAGVLNVMRAAGVVPAKTLDPPDSNR